MTALDYFSRGYETLIGLLDGRRRMRPDTVLSLIQEAASFAMVCHPGRFADGTLENVVFEMGAELSSTSLFREGRELCTPIGSKRRVLHLLSTATEIGGHTRTLVNWIKADPTSRHCVVLTDQKSIPVPDWLVATVNGHGGAILDLPVGLGLVAMAGQIRAMARSGADVVVLHHGGHDLAPILALASDDLPPVAVLNHADHQFWLGSSVIDIVVNQRAAGANLSERRFSLRNTVLPIPLGQMSGESRGDARLRLGIPPDRLMLLSIGRAIKYAPTKRHNFLRTLRAVLDRAPTAHLYIVGLSEVEAARFPGYSPHPRIHLRPATPDPSGYRSAADVYLESFPFGSATAMLEAAQAGLPSALQYDPPFELLATNHGLEALLHSAKTEENYIEEVSDLVADSERQRWLGSRLAAHISAHHTGEGWREHLSRVYAEIEGLTHATRRIPVSPRETSPADVALSEWHMDIKTNQRSSPDVREVTEEVINVSYAARWNGDHRGAFEVLWRRLRTAGLDRRIVTSAAKVPVHWAARVCGLAAPAPGPVGAVRVLR